MIEKFESRLGAWENKFLSMGGRIVLLNSVLSALPTYFFSFMKAPISVIQRLTQLQRNFLWGGKIGDDRRKIAWVAWEDICRPKQEGGLGVKNLKVFNHT